VVLTQPAAQDQLPKEVSEWIQQAEALEGQRAYGKALAQWQKVLAWMRTNPQLSEVTKAAFLHQFGWLLMMSGRPGEAVDPTEEAVGLRRRLTASSAGVEAELALSLRLLGMVFGKLNRPRDAQPPTLEAIAIYRRLERGDSTFRDDLALSLYNLGVQFTMLNRHEDALDPTIQSAII
jgi:tetratricopeptide (TPR) repeat protein